MFPTVAEFKRALIRWKDVSTNQSLLWKRMMAARMGALAKGMVIDEDVYGGRHSCVLS